VSKQLARAGTHILDFSNGFYTVDRRLIYPGIEKGVLPNLRAVRDLAADLDCIVSLAGNVTDLRDVPELSDRMIISVGRALIADPHFARKARLGQFAAIVQCERTGHCHYFSRGKDHIECGVNQEFVRIN
jgi:NADPH2 dehydrogenase